MLVEAMGTLEWAKRPIIRYFQTYYIQRTFEKRLLQLIIAGNLF